MGPQLGDRPQRELRRFTAGEDDPIGGDHADVQSTRGPDRHRAGHRFDTEDVTWPAICGGSLQFESLALADGEGKSAVVLAEHLPGFGVDH